MRIATRLGPLLVGILMAASASAQPFTASLAGSKERPTPNSSTAMGATSATLTGNQLVVTGSFSGLTGNYAASHLHTGGAEEAGPVIFPLSPTVSADMRGGTFAAASNTFMLSAAQVAALQASGIYVNVHSATFNGGEIRGQLVAVRNDDPQPLPFSQNWTNIGLITADDDWSGVPGIIGYRGDDLAPTTAMTDIRTVLIDGSGTPVDVIANRNDPSVFSSGGVVEFEIADPVVALQGSGTSDFPHIVIRINTTGQRNIRVRYNLRDIDDGSEAVQAFGLHYRVGTTGDYTNVPAGYVADASDAGATKVTAIDATLPANANNQASVDIRVITYNALGSDEFIGVDDIQITGDVSTSTAEAPESGLSLDVANPVRGTATVRFSTEQAGEATLTLVDVLGRTVATLAEGASVGSQTATLDTAGLAPGVYVLRLTAGTGVLARTLTVVR